ncbi:MAG: MBL fold metallo-hydrolase [Bacteroidota bacterium]|nr:MBL fold metallo-hydrolase [Bacteroidota bacterium]
MNEKQNVKIRFLGAAGTVTGSKHLLDVGDKKILIDCGLFQGLKELRLRNWEPLPFDVSTLEFVVLTHGHLDHVGHLPLLVKQGFKGTIYATEPTIDIAKLILADSARIQEEDAERANHYKYTKHKPAKPLYTVKEAEAVFPLFKAKQLDKWIELFPGTSFRFCYNGHIVGATFVEIKIGEKVIVFSGDIGRNNDLLLRDPQQPSKADVLVIESTYGDRIHPSEKKEKLAEILNEAMQKKGTIIIPSFAVERAQLLMYYLWQLRHEGKIPAIPVYLDSPMGVSVLDVFKRHEEWHKLSAEVCLKITKETKVVRKLEETARVAQDKSAKVIIAASGMASGGRVLTYFEHFLGDANATVLLSGYQGEGTRGRALLEGAKEVKLRGKLYPVKAGVSQIEGLSAHADQSELIHWMSSLKEAPGHIFIVHGEKTGAEGLKAKIKEVFGYSSVIPTVDKVYNLF